MDQGITFEIVFLRVSPCLENAFSDSLLMLSLEVPIRLNYIGLGQGGFEVLEKLCKMDPIIRGSQLKITIF